MTQNILQVNSAAITDKGLSEKRPQNEDSYLELRDSGLYAVADGVGGAQAGDVASQMAMEILGEAFINLQEDGDAEERMKVAIEKANSAIFQMSNELPQLSTMATTIVVVHINGNIATIGHVGDSRLYRLDENGNLYQETQDHSVVEEEVRAGRMTPEQALTHPSRNVISRALGAEYNVEIDMKTIMFEPNTKFLVCSDGVTRHIPDDELRSLLVQEEDNFIICQTIKELCYERGAEDNLTAVVVSIKEATEESFDPDPNDIEEDTVAASRPPLVNSGVIAQQDVETGEISTQGLELPDTARQIGESDLNTIVAKKDEITVLADNENSDRISISPNEETGKTESENKVTKDIKSYRVDESNGSGFTGKLISGILWLLIGAVLGALGYYLWTRNMPTTDNNTGNQTANVQLTAFENNRRNVDKDPQKFIADLSNPKDAIDHYLLGRAFILIGNYDSAKRELKKAKEMLGDVEEINKKVLENDISIALGKVNSNDNSKEAENNSNNGRNVPKAEDQTNPVKDSPVINNEAEGKPLKNLGNDN